MTLTDIAELIESERTQIGASSCTFYVRDPFWQEGFYLAAMTGVTHTEPMHGFSFPPHPNKILIDGPSEIFSTDSRNNKQLREDVAAGLEEISPEKSLLFGDFVEREGIRSSVRLIHKIGNRIDAVLFVNFTQPQLFKSALKVRLRKLLKAIVGDLPQLTEEIRASETNALVQAIRIFPPTHEPETSQTQSDELLKTSLEALLEVIIRALELDPKTTFGTIHRYNRVTKTLTLAASKGKIVNKGLADSLSVPKGEGIISWVAIRRKALLVTDLKKSDLGRKIHLPFNKNVRSEVAIPIFAHNELLGVLNLESYKKEAFKSNCVRSLWFAVNRVAVANRLAQQANIITRLRNLSDELLALCAEYVSQGTGSLSLDRLAVLATNALATEYLDAALCDIWRLNKETLTFELAGKSYQTFEPEAPREAGWSHFIRETGWSVWIHNTHTDSDFNVNYWNGEGWNLRKPRVQPPTKLNVGTQARGVKSRLCIPIKVRGRCVGVAWLEYARDQETPPGPEFMKLAAGFAAHAGLFIEFSQVDLVDKDAVQQIGKTLFKNLLASGPLRLDDFPHIRGHVMSKPFPYSSIGGDFYAARVIDERTASVLVGDGEGHAVTGALNMLPMLAIFEAFWKDSRSAVHIMDKILDMSIKLGVRGEAIYCVFRRIMDEHRTERLWLSATVAGGNIKLIIIQKRAGETRTFSFPTDKTARGYQLGWAILNSPLAEQQEELSKGDIIIIYTDGLDLEVSEVESAGLDNIKEEPSVIADAIFERASEKRKRYRTEVEDDQTALVIRVN